MSANIKTVSFTDPDGLIYFMNTKRPSIDGVQRDYSNADTPRGKDSVIFQTCKDLKNAGVNLGFELPKYTKLQLQTLSAAELFEGNIAPVIPAEISKKFKIQEFAGA